MISPQTVFVAAAAAASVVHTAQAFLPPSTPLRSSLMAVKTGRPAHRFATSGSKRTVPMMQSLAIHAPVASVIEESPYSPGPTYTFSSGLKLNLFGLYYGFVSIGLGLMWWTALTVVQFLLWAGKIVTFGKGVDKNRRMAIWVSHVWAVFVLIFSNCWPKIRGRENLRSIYDKNIPAMYVANHCSWMDIPFLAMSIGWRNYKIVSKQELLKVPILHKALKVSDHVILDRTSRRSQLETYKKGVAWLKNGVNLCTFPEGTRSEDGKLGTFKRGAFKMAQAVGVPIVPVSIRYAHLMNPKDWVFPFRSGGSIPVDVILGKPIPTEGKSDDELMKEVREALIAELPECQKPLPDSPTVDLD